MKFGSHMIFHIKIFRIKHLKKPRHFNEQGHLPGSESAHYKNDGKKIIFPGARRGNSHSFVQRPNNTHATTRDPRPGLFSGAS